MATNGVKSPLPVLAHKPWGTSDKFDFGLGSGGVGRVSGGDQESGRILVRSLYQKG